MENSELITARELNILIQLIVHLNSFFKCKHLDKDDIDFMRHCVHALFIDIRDVDNNPHRELSMRELKCILKGFVLGESKRLSKSRKAKTLSGFELLLSGAELIRFEQDDFLPKERFLQIREFLKKSTTV